MVGHVLFFDISNGEVSVPLTAKADTNFDEGESRAPVSICQRSFSLRIENWYRSRHSHSVQRVFLLGAQTDCKLELLNALP
jgi:hypothetical protein